MPLSTLAPELIHLLLSVLVRQDVSRLSQTCKRLRSISLPQVYRTLRWTWEVQKAHNLETVSPPMHLLLRSVTENPQLGDHVEHVQLQKNADGFPPRTEDALWAPFYSPKVAPSGIGTVTQWVEHFDLASPREIHPALQRVQPFYVASPDHWSEALRRGDIQAYFALTLAFFPKLCSLVLSTDRTTNSRFIGSLFTHAVGPVAKAPPFGKLPSYELLRDVRMEVASDGPVRFLDMYSVFYLPSLETLTIGLGSAKRFQWPSLSQNRPTLASLTTLKLTYCEATEDALERILSSKPPLKELLYNYSAAEESEGEYFNLSTLSRALKYVYTTLESLTLEIEFQPDSDEVPVYSNGPFTGTIDSFHHFPHLTHLEIPFAMLTGWHHIPRHTRTLSSLLPHSLRYLCLTDDLADWENYNWDRPKDWLERLHDLLAGGLLGLEKVQLNLQIRGPRWSDDHKAELEILCVRYGVEGLFNRRDRYPST